MAAENLQKALKHATNIEQVMQNDQFLSKPDRQSDFAENLMKEDEEAKLIVSEEIDAARKRQLKD